MTEEQVLQKLIKKWGIPVVKWTNPEYLLDEAKEAGAVVVYNLNNSLDFNFNKKGRFVGTSTDSINSWVYRGGRKKRVRRKTKSNAHNRV